MATMLPQFRLPSAFRKQVQVEEHVVDPGPQDAAGAPPMRTMIQHVILLDAVMLGLLHAEQQARPARRCPRMMPYQ